MFFSLKVIRVKYSYCLDAELPREIRKACAGESSAPGCRSSCRGHSTVEEDQVGRHLLPCCQAMLNIVFVVSWIRKLCAGSEFVANWSRSVACWIQCCWSASFLRIRIRISSKHMYLWLFTRKFQYAVRNTLKNDNYVTYEKGKTL